MFKNQSLSFDFQKAYTWKIQWLFKVQMDSNLAVLSRFFKFDVSVKILPIIILVIFSYSI